MNDRHEYLAGLKKANEQRSTRAAARAASRAAGQNPQKPLFYQAVEAGVVDISYGTHRYGWIASYRGEAVVEMPNGGRWQCIGHRSTGTATSLKNHGFIEFVELD